MADEGSGEFKEVNKGSPAKATILLIALLLNAVVMGAVAFLQFQSHQKRAKEPSIRDIVQAEMKVADEARDEDDIETEFTGEAMDEDGLLFPLEGFTSNLAQGDGPRRFIRLSPVLKFSKDSNEEEFKARKPQIRDTIISILNSKRSEDLLKIQGKEFLKNEIKAAINTFLVDGQVIDVYYVGFQIN